jgi:CBS domain-containing protein
MASDLIYAFRVTRLPLLDSDGGTIGKLEDIVVAPPYGDDPPSVLGFVASSQRRRIFVNAHRIATLDNDGARLRSGAIDLNHFRKREGELLVTADVLDKRVGSEHVSDIALRAVPGQTSEWEVAAVALGTRSGPLRRKRTVRVVDWAEVRWLFDTTPVAAEVAALRDMHPHDVAAAIRNLPAHHRRQLAEVMDDERLADLLEELPEPEQLRLIEGLDLERLVSVLDEMESDDAVDLLSEMPGEARSRVLDAMEPEEADEMRRLLSYGEETAGGLMNSDPVILGPHATVAEALARIRDPELSVTLAAQVYVTQPPWDTPTGIYLGVVHFQRLLREPPGMELGKCTEDEPPVAVDLPDTDVAVRLASYNLVSVAVCDAERRLLGVVTVDDVLDRSLPAGWRQRIRETAG